MSSSAPDRPAGPPRLGDLPEPDPFTPTEFGAWRGMLRVHATVFRQLDERLLTDHGFGIDAYGILVTLVGAPDGTLTIGELGQRRNLSPSGISRSVDRLTKIGLIQRTVNPADGRSLLVGLTPQGLTRLRAAQVTHHEIVRELLLDRLEEQDQKLMAQLWEKAMPGAVTSHLWPL
jgi:DNA-binding MarR family transcriptional regulator